MSEQSPTFMNELALSNNIINCQYYNGRGEIIGEKTRLGFEPGLPESLKSGALPMELNCFKIKEFHFDGKNWYLARIGPTTVVLCVNLVNYDFKLILNQKREQ